MSSNWTAEIRVTLMKGRAREMKRTAEVCGEYRYRLGRLWDESLPVCLWIMLNPSKADAKKDDRTIRRCIDYAKRWSFGGILVGNLFALRSPYPERLYQAEDPVGPKNDRRLRAMLNKADLVVCGWGAHSMVRERAREVLVMLGWPRPRPSDNQRRAPASPVDATKEPYAHPIPRGNQGRIAQCVFLG